jgi:hypothetical protein
VVVSFRLSHHLETQELRERHLRELFRVARKHVIVTWFSATSLKNLLREVRVKLAGKKPKNVLRNDRVRAIAAGCRLHAAHGEGTVPDRLGPRARPVHAALRWRSSHQPCRSLFSASSTSR